MDHGSACSRRDPAHAAQRVVGRSPAVPTMTATTRPVPPARSPARPRRRHERTARPASLWAKSTMTVRVAPPVQVEPPGAARRGRPEAAQPGGDLRDGCAHRTGARRRRQRVGDVVACEPTEGGGDVRHGARASAPRARLELDQLGPVEHEGPATAARSRRTRAARSAQREQPDTGPDPRATPATSSSSALRTTTPSGRVMRAMTDLTSRQLGQRVDARGGPCGRS